MKKLAVEEKLALDAIKPQDEPHIVLVEARCRACSVRPCLTACPAHLYTVSPETGEVVLEHAGCLECGTCLALCPEHLSWSYPAGSFGVQYRHG
jgi:ferredoxin like protein